MHKTYSEHITDTATFIPSTIHIPTPSLSDHVHPTSGKLSPALTQIFTIWTITKANNNNKILKLAEILHQDNTPTIQLPSLPTHTSVIPESDGAPTNTLPSTSTSYPVLATSEGVPTSAIKTTSRIPITLFPTSEGD